MAIEVLRSISVSGHSELARVEAANSLLDRAHGKPVSDLRWLGELFGKKPATSEGAR